MFRVNLEDGSTIAFDLAHKRDRDQWLAVRSDPSFHERIRAIHVISDGSTWVVKRPAKMGRVWWDIEDVYDTHRDRIARERVIWYAGQTKAITTVYIAGKAPFCVSEAIRVGKLRHPAFASNPAGG